MDVIDFNGAVWSQSGHNLLKAGLEATAGVPAPFFFGSMPIPPEDYYVHHPALLSLMVGGLFRVFGEHEWVARMIPVTCSTVSLLLLALLGLRRWESTGTRLWGGAMLLGFGMAMMTAWLGYLLTLLFCGYFLLFERARHGRLAGVLLGMAAFCAALFASLIHWLCA